MYVKLESFYGNAIAANGNVHIIANYSATKSQIQNQNDEFKGYDVGIM